jgi:hypothetical protein
MKNYSQQNYYTVKKNILSGKGIYAEKIEGKRPLGRTKSRIILKWTFNKTKEFRMNKLNSR